MTEITVNALKDLREHCGHTQQTIADVLDCDQATVSRYEQNPNNMHASEIEKLSRFYGITPNDVMALAKGNYQEYRHILRHTDKIKTKIPTCQCGDKIIYGRNKKSGTVMRIRWDDDGCAVYEVAPDEDGDWVSIRDDDLWYPAAIEENNATESTDNKNSPTVLDLLREIIEEAQKEEVWPKEDMSIMERALCAGKSFYLDFSRDKIDTLFTGIRRMVEDNILIHTYDNAYDHSGRYEFTTTDPHPYLGPITSSNYYGSFILYPFSCDPATLEGFQDNNSNLSLFYNQPINSDSTGVEELELYFNANRLSISSKKEEDMPDIIGQVTGGRYLPFNHLVSFYVKEKGGSIRDFQR